MVLSGSRIAKLSVAIGFGFFKMVLSGFLAFVGMSKSVKRVISSLDTCFDPGKLLESNILGATVDAAK